MHNRNIVIIGAGLAGLSAAWHLQQKGARCTVLEKESSPGGLCRSKTADGFVFDYCGHLLHFRHQYAYTLVSRLLGEHLRKHHRSSWVYFKGDYVRYPFQANLHGLPPAIIKECLLGFIGAQENREIDFRCADFAGWIQRTFGPGIAKYFMLPYNTKFWTIHPRRMTCEWMEGFIPVPSLADVVEGTVETSRKQFGYNADFWYPAAGGIGAFTDAFAAEVKGITTGSEVSRVLLPERRVVLRDGRELSYDWLISTMPLPRLAAISSGLPREAAAAGRKLRWNSIINLNLGIEGDPSEGRHWVYFPQKELSFFRIGYFNNFSHANAPPGHSAMYVELSYSREKPADRERAVRMIRRDLARIGVRRDAVRREDVNDIEFAYPIFDRDYAPSRAALLDAFHANRVLPCGRYGAWRYLSMEDVIMDGRRAAEGAMA